MTSGYCKSRHTVYRRILRLSKGSMTAFRFREALRSMSSEKKTQFYKEARDMNALDMVVKFLPACKEDCDREAEQLRLTASIAVLTSNMKRTIQLYEEMKCGASAKSEDLFIHGLKQWLALSEHRGEDASPTKSQEHRKETAAIADGTTIADGTAETGANGEESKGHLSQKQNKNSTS